MTTAVRDALRRALDTALKDRDRTAMRALRTALATLDNAEAADPSAAPAVESGAVAGGVAGLGAGEVSRRELTDDACRDLLLAELARWRALADDFDRAGRPAEAAEQRAQADVIATAIGTATELT